MKRAAGHAAVALLTWKMKAALLAAGVIMLVVVGLLATTMPGGAFGGGGCGSAPVVGNPPQELADVVGKDNVEVANRHVKVITDASIEAGLPARAAVIAVATAIQESRLANLEGGDRDSAGLFQQRPSMGWGSLIQIRDPRLSSLAFFGAADHTTNPGLKDIPDWQQLPLTEAAQAVQRSGFPDAYAQWEQLSIQLVSQFLTDGVVRPIDSDCPGGSPISGEVGSVVDAAKSQLGVPYSWGGGGPSGPSEGFGLGEGVVGFDCSSLMQFAWWQGTGGAVALPRVSRAQHAALPPVDPANVAPGDLIFLQKNGQVHHVGMVIENGGIIHAPRTGKNVSIVRNAIDSNGIPQGSYWGGRFAGYRRAVVPQKD